MVEKCKFSNNKIIDVESTVKTAVLILNYQNYWNSAAAVWRWHTLNILRSNITNHVPTAGGAGGRGDQPADAPPQQVKILFHSFEQKKYSHVTKKIFQELATAAPAQLQRVRVYTEAGACPAGARGRVHVQTSGWVDTWPRGIETMMGLQIARHRQDVLVKRQRNALYSVRAYVQEG